ncbi:hypothetical protein LHFGNBLO_000128 [Mesorhizobium sp. AR10]|uniref:hypothetical protein n=1 Tax=Mesorhizobium sp. AR10 TaxID=2865839 RepID=UPI0021601A48|nr:hypothetical protein [Mesorhizobium sp. AR10]UVK38835.1 hypothetical protein LHFGNBLO_000128 [Mesorhizobium sp. AR10]
MKPAIGDPGYIERVAGADFRSAVVAHYHPRDATPVSDAVASGNRRFAPVRFMALWFP